MKLSRELLPCRCRHACLGKLGGQAHGKPEVGHNPSVVSVWLDLVSMGQASLAMAREVGGDAR
jgi:hypothetical protein